MAITNTTLSAALSATGTRIYVASASGATVGQSVKIEDEYAIVEAISGTVIDLKHRGDRGTLANAHTSGATVSFFASESDLGTPGPRQRDAFQYNAWAQDSIAADGAITVPTQDTMLYITKASAAALTLANPGKDSNGVWLHIISRTAAAHTVTYTDGFQEDTTTSDVATFAAKKGANLLLRAVDGKWICVNIVASATAQVVVA